MQQNWNSQLWGDGKLLRLLSCKRRFSELTSQTSPEKATTTGMSIFKEQSSATALHIMSLTIAFLKKTENPLLGTTDLSPLCHF